MAGPWESMISSWGSWGEPGGWIPPGHPWCPTGTSLSSWLDFRGIPLSRWTTPNTFARFYSLLVEPVSSRVLGNRHLAGKAGRCHACCANPPHPAWFPFRPSGQSYVVLPQAWVSPYRCLNMLPPFGQDVASIATFSGRPASPSLLPSCNKQIGKT